MPAFARHVLFAVSAIAASACCMIRPQPFAHADYYQAPPPPITYYEPQVVWYVGMHPTMHGGNWCVVGAAHTHEYDPPWGYLFVFHGGYYYYDDDPTGYSTAHTYIDHHPHPWGGWCHRAAKHRHHYAPAHGQGTTTYRVSSGNYVYIGPDDASYQAEHANYDSRGRLKGATAYQQHKAFRETNNAGRPAPADAGANGREGTATVDPRGTPGDGREGTTNVDPRGGTTRGGGGATTNVVGNPNLGPATRGNVDHSIPPVSGKPTPTPTPTVRGGRGGRTDAIKKDPKKDSRQDPKKDPKKDDPKKDDKKSDDDKKEEGSRRPKR